VVFHPEVRSGEAWQSSVNPPREPLPFTSHSSVLTKAFCSFRPKLRANPRWPLRLAC